MSMVNNIGGATLSAAVVAGKGLDPNKNVTQAKDSAGVELNASVAAYMSLPGFNFNPAAPVDASQASDTVNAADKASAVIKAVAESGDDGLKEALKQFDEGLKRLAMRPETQIFQAKFGLDSSYDTQLPAPDPLPGVSKDGTLGAHSGQGDGDNGADLNHDGKISEDELRRYQLPITYRSSEATTDALVDGPTAFSLAEANRAYGVVAAALA